MMFEKLPAVVTSGVVTAAILTFVVPAAHADVVASSVVLRDGPGDVWTRVSDQEEPTRADFPAADVTRVLVSHGPAAVRVRMRFDDLRRVGIQRYVLEIGTPRNVYFAHVVSAPRARRGTHRFDSSRTSGCRGMTHRINYVRNVVTTRIPRRCLGRPQWVRVGLENTLTRDPGKHRTVFTDNPHNHGAFSDEVTRRLYRG
jgi:hypothetical protein